MDRQSVALTPLGGRHVGGLGLDEFGGDAAGLPDFFHQHGPAYSDSPGLAVHALKRIAFRVGHPVVAMTGLDPYGVHGDQALALGFVHGRCAERQLQLTEGRR